MRRNVYYNNQATSETEVVVFSEEFPIHLHIHVRLVRVSGTQCFKDISKPFQRYTVNINFSTTNLNYQINYSKIVIACGSVIFFPKG